MRRLIIAFDSDSVGRDGSGNETFSRGLISGLQQILSGSDRLLLFGSQISSIHEIISDPNRTTAIPIPAGPRGQATWGNIAARHGANVAIGHWVAPIHFPGITAVVLHDVAWHRTPAAFPAIMRARLEMTTRHALATTDLIFTGSNFSKSEFHSVYPRSRRIPIIVSHYPPDDRFRLSEPKAEAAGNAARIKFGLPHHFALAVGNIQPRKNLQVAAEAARLAKVQLIVAGRPVWRNRSECKAMPNVRWLGYVDLLDLPGLFAAASVFVFPSLYEGYGLPVVEAMAAGCPVVCSSAAAIPEAAGDAAVLTAPMDVHGFACGIQSILRSAHKAQTLRTAGRIRVVTLSWATVAADYVAAIRGYDNGSH